MTHLKQIVFKPTYIILGIEKNISYIYCNKIFYHVLFSSFVIYAQPTHTHFVLQKLPSSQKLNDDKDVEGQKSLSFPCLSNRSPS